MPTAEYRMSAGVRQHIGRRADWYAAQWPRWVAAGSYIRPTEKPNKEHPIMTDIPVTPNPARTQLLALQRQLAEAAREKDAADEAYKQAEAAWKAANAPLIARRDAARQSYEALDAQARPLMVQAYQETGLKSLLTGLTIEHNRTVTFDPTAVTLLAHLHKPEWLVLDEKAVRKFALDQAVEVLTADGEKALRMPDALAWLPVEIQLVPGPEISKKALATWLTEQEAEPTPTVDDIPF